MVEVLKRVNKGVGVGEAWEESGVLRALHLNRLQGLVEHEQAQSTKKDRRTCILS